MYIIWSVQQEINKRMPKENSKTWEIWKRFRNCIRIFLSWSQGMMEIWLPRVTTQPLLKWTWEFLSSSSLLWPEGNKKWHDLSNIIPPFKGHSCQERGPAGTPSTSVMLDNFRLKCVKAWRVPGDLLSWLNYRQAEAESESWQAFLTVTVHFLCLQHQAVRAEAVKLGSLRRLLEND